MATIKGDLFVNYNGEMVQTDLSTSAEMVKGLDTTLNNRFASNIQRDTAANFKAANTILQAGKIGVEEDTGLMKIGDGTNTWNKLAYAGGTSEIPIVKNDSELTDVHGNVAFIVSQ